MVDTVSGKAIQTMIPTFGPAKKTNLTLTGTHGGTTVNFTTETGSALTTMDNLQITKIRQTMIAI